MPIGPVTSTLAAASDAVTLPIAGVDFGTARVSFTGTATCTITWEMSLDGGTNWIASPYAKRLDATASNPTVAATYGPSGATGTSFEIPIPADCTHVRGRVSAYTSGTLVANASPGRRYEVGTVTATLYDVATTAGANNNTGTLELGGWTAASALIVVTTAITGTATHNIVDDAGTATVIGTAASLATGTYVWLPSLGTAVVPNATLTGVATPALPLPKRWSIVTTGATTSAQRILITVRR